MKKDKNYYNNYYRENKCCILERHKKFEKDKYDLDPIHREKVKKLSRSRYKPRIKKQKISKPIFTLQPVIPKTFTVKLKRRLKQERIVTKQSNSSQILLKILEVHNEQETA
jgi:hypothetical protein